MTNARSPSTTSSPFSQASTAGCPPTCPCLKSPTTITWSASWSSSGGTPRAEGADHAFVNFAEDDTSCESFYLQAQLVVLAILKHRGEFADHARVRAEFELLPRLLVARNPQARHLFGSRAR